MNETPPRVSLGMPVYNAEQFLREAVDSILAQTFTDFELIISDNGSTDGTEAMCREFALADPRIQYHRIDSNRGAAWNYNRTFELARGEYFKWAAHDDLIEPETLALCVEALDREPEAVLSYPKAWFIDQTGNRTRAWDDDLHLSDPEPHRRLAHYFGRVSRCNVVMGLIRASALRRTRLIDTFAGCDYVLLAELAMLGKFHEVPERLFSRRLHAGSSREAHLSPLEVARWFDTSFYGRILFPKFRIIKEFMVSVKRAKLPPGEKFLCFLAIRRWMLARLRTIGGRCKARLLAKSRG